MFTLRFQSVTLAAALANVSLQITSAINEMAANSNEITKSVELCRNLSDENQSNLSDLKQEVDLFKIN